MPFRQLVDLQETAQLKLYIRNSSNKVQRCSLITDRVLASIVASRSSHWVLNIE